MSQAATTAAPGAPDAAAAGSGTASALPPQLLPIINPVSPLGTPEKSRMYVYADGYRLSLSNVTAVGVAPNGNHRVETGDGKKHLVVSGWKTIEIVGDVWYL